jgi:hypothetical protein
LLRHPRRLERPREGDGRCNRRIVLDGNEGEPRALIGLREQLGLGVRREYAVAALKLCAVDREVGLMDQLVGA